MALHEILLLGYNSSYYCCIQNQNAQSMPPTNNSPLATSIILSQKNLYEFIVPLYNFKIVLWYQNKYACKVIDEWLMTWQIKNKKHWYPTKINIDYILKSTFLGHPIEKPGIQFTYYPHTQVVITIRMFKDHLPINQTITSKSLQVEFLRCKSFDENYYSHQRET